MAWYRVWREGKSGDTRQAMDEDDAVVRRWETLVESQTKALVDPLVQQVAALRTEVNGLEAKVERLEATISEIRRKYWDAIPYIRLLQAMLRPRLRDGEHLPTPPERIADDI